MENVGDTIQISLHVRKEVLSLIDRAAKVNRQSRSAFMDIASEQEARKLLGGVDNAQQP